MARHVEQTRQTSPGNETIALVGQPNVGKSVIFHHLTGRYVTVANYPGTTVEITRGAARGIPKTTVIDTPGVITFPSHTEDECVTANLLLNEHLRAILQVGDAKNLRRTLLLAIQLAEMGIPLVIALNMMDEAEERGITIDHSLLSEHLGIPVIPTIATHGEGIEEIIEKIQKTETHPSPLHYPHAIESALAETEPLLLKSPISSRALALLWLTEDPAAETWIKDHTEPEIFDQLLKSRAALCQSIDEAPSTLIHEARFTHVDRLTQLVLRESGKGWHGLAERLGHLAIHPIWGALILITALYALYWFVGVFGAGTLVGLLEEKLFGEIINPWLTNTLARWVPIPILNELLIGPYGLWTMGITYALALILPIVTTFFLAFGIMEDSGYLPRLAVLSNRLFRMMGLNGRAVLPMVLGLGCVTMATLTTRVLETKRERLLVILLLALAVPCSAQLGIVMGMLASISLTATLIWLVVIGGTFLLAGWLAAKVLPGDRTPLLLELPPIRWPTLASVFTKTLARLEWYLKEVLPLFLAGAAILFVMDKTSLLQSLFHLGEPLMTRWLGLPAEASSAFLLGFLRRDFGATGFFVMESQGLLTPQQVVVAMVTITLFVPCIAALLMIAKSRGWGTMLAMIAIVFPLAFLVGGLLRLILSAIGWGL